MTSFIPFFKESNRIIQQWCIIRGWAGPRNFRSFTFGLCAQRPYCIFRDRTIETSEYFLLFNDDDYVGINVAFPSAFSFKFENDCYYLNVSHEEAYEALFNMFEFIVWDAFRKGIQVIFGSFSYTAGFNNTNEPILKALTELGFVINDTIPDKPLCTKWLQAGQSAIEQAFLRAGCTDKRFTGSYGRLPAGDYFFISCKPLSVTNTFLYTIQFAPHEYCQLHGRIHKHALTLSQPHFHSTNLLLFPLLVRQITFDAFHHKLHRSIKLIRLLLDEDFATWLEPALSRLGFCPSVSAAMHTFWRTV